jgi:phage tail sheath gpL-like
MSEEEEGKAIRVGYSADQATVDGIDKATVDLTNAAGKHVAASVAFRALQKIGSDFWQYVVTDEDEEVVLEKVKATVRESRTEYRKLVEGLKKE